MCFCTSWNFCVRVSDAVFSQPSTTPVAQGLVNFENAMICGFEPTSRKYWSAIWSWRYEFLGPGKSSGISRGRFDDTMWKPLSQ